MSIGGQRHAIVVLPVGSGRWLANTEHRRWLSRGRVTYHPAREEPLHRIVKLLGRPPVTSGLGALRAFGQQATENSPTQPGHAEHSWVAAADPVHFIAGLHEVRVQHLDASSITATDLADIASSLQPILADSGLHFSHNQQFGYIHAKEPLSTADVSSLLAHGCRPDEWLFEKTTKGNPENYHRFIGEVQLLLHEHPVNLRRLERGLAPINSLWLWGGGALREAPRGELPRLVADDPLVRGYWMHSGGDVDGWPGNLASCVSDARANLVIVCPSPMPEQPGETWSDNLDLLHGALRRGSIASLHLLTGDGLHAYMSRWDLLRIWRPVSSVFSSPEVSGDAHG